MNLSLAIFHDEETAKEWGWVQVCSVELRLHLQCVRGTGIQCVGRPAVLHAWLSCLQVRADVAGPVLTLQSTLCRRCTPSRLHATTRRCLRCICTRR